MLDTAYFDAYDSGTFRNYCGPAQLHKDLNTLYGLIVGIQADGHINETEIDLLYSWVNLLGTLRTKAPYYKLVAKINEILEDGIVTEEEAEDFIWLCRSYLDYNTNPYYNVITSMDSSYPLLFVSLHYKNLYKRKALFGRRLARATSWKIE